LAVIEEVQQQDPMTIFLYALKAPETRRQWPRRLKVFLDFLKLEGITMEERAKQFMIKARQNPQWAQDNLIKFIAFQIERQDGTKYQKLLFQITIKRQSYFVK
jgi:hypothetical protein